MAYPAGQVQVCTAYPYRWGRESQSVGSTLGGPIPRCGVHSVKQHTREQLLAILAAVPQHTA